MVLWHQAAVAQCPGGVPPLQIVQYDSTSIGDDLSYFPYDQFDPSMGTLLGVSVRVKVTGLIRMTVINYNTTPRAFDVEVRRRDYFMAPGLGIYIMVDSTVNYNTNPIPAAQYPGTPPTYSDRVPNDDFSNINERLISAPVNKEVIQEITDPAILANYLGTGAIELEYALSPGYSVEGFGSSQTESRITTYNTRIVIELIYTYCPNSILPTGKLEFDAAKQADNNVLLTWTKEKETNGILYTPEISTDGKNFSGIGAMQSQQPANESTIVKYQFDYRLPGITNDGKIYFRLKQTAVNGQISYSETRVINFETLREKLSLYPNPAERNVTLSFDSQQKDNLNLALLNSSGQVVETRNISPGGARTYNFAFTRNHPPGVYFVRVINAATRQQQVLRLMIR